MSAPRFSTFGCRLNTYETEAMSRLAREAGLDENTLVVNSCAVTAEAVRKARQELRRLRRENPEARLVVTGCAAQTEPELFAGMPEVDVVMGNREKLAHESWARLGEGPRVNVSDIMQARVAPAPLVDGIAMRARAIVQIQNGCDHRCTFCIIPHGRGNSRSVPAEHVLEQVRRLAGLGHREVVLTGVDLTSWGADLEGTPRLGELVRAILRAVPDLPRLRLSSIDSIEADPELIEAIATEPRLAPHLHLSLQHGDDLILKRMKRRHLRDDAIRFCQEVRALRPDITFGADLIAGFPTETRAHFENTLKLVEDCGLTWLHVFPYSARPGTPAARMPQVSGPEIRARAEALRALGRERARLFLEAQVGRTLDVLVETPRRGRTPHFAEVAFSRDMPTGQIVAAPIAGTDTRRLLA